MGGRGARLSNPVPQFREIIDEYEQIKWGESHYGAWQKSLAKEERNSLAWYTADGSQSINAYLRDKTVDPQNPHKEDVQTIQYIEQIDAALNRSRATEALRVFRGLKDMDELYESIVDGSLPINGVLTSPGYSSASLQRGTAKTFMKEDHGYGIMVEIDIPVGTPGAYLVQDFESDLE